MGRAWQTARRRPRACVACSVLLYLLCIVWMPSLVSWQRRLTSSVLAGGQSLPSSTPNRLILVLPFTIGETRTLLENIERWGSDNAGKACSSTSRQYVDLGLLYHKTRETLMFDVGELRKTPELQPALGCFGDVVELFADLTPEEDIYPAGPSVMFFRVYTDPAIKAQLKHYGAMFWMETDTFPIKPLWVDKLYAESRVHDDFWVRGSIYLGPAFDETVKTPANWDWVGHINGNALYRLNDPEFDDFLSLVADVEPPLHFWKPFDVSIWKVLHAFPYYWRIHQHYISRFSYATYIQHWGFTITPDDIQASQLSDDVFLVHGKNTSAGIIKYKAKFKDKQALSKAHVNWNGVLDARDDVCVMIRSWRGDVKYAAMAAKSVLKHMPGAADIVLVIPEEDYEIFKHPARRSNSHAKVRLVREPRLIADDHVQQKYSKLMADTYCTNAFIFHLDSDMVFSRTVYRKDLFFMGRPIMEYDRYDNLPEEARQWKLGTSKAVGKDVEHEFSRSNNRMYPRAVYSAARTHIEQQFGTTVAEFLSDVDMLEEAFSVFNYIGAYMWHHMRDAMWWVPRDPKDVAPTQRRHMRPIIPPFVCKGNARLARHYERAREDMTLLSSAMESGNCSGTKRLGAELLKHAARVTVELPKN